MELESFPNPTGKLKRFVPPVRFRDSNAGTRPRSDSHDARASYTTIGTFYKPSQIKVNVYGIIAKSLELTQDIPDSNSMVSGEVKGHSDEGRRLYPTWQNVGNTCWLDSALIMLTSCDSLENLLAFHQEESLTNKLMVDYDRLRLMVNKTVSCNVLPKEVKMISVGNQLTMPYDLFKLYINGMTDLREEVRNYLKERNIGQETFDTPLFAIPSILNSSPSLVREKFSFSCSYFSSCTNCGNVWQSRRESTIMPVPSLNKVERFTLSGSSFSFLTPCRVCHSEEKVNLKWEMVQKCLLLQFPDGLPQESDIRKLAVNDSKLELKGLVQYTRKHFITWIQIDKGWLKFDDLSGDDVVNSDDAVPGNDQGLPPINSSEIHMAYLCEESTKQCLQTALSHSEVSINSHSLMLPVVNDTSFSERRSSQSSTGLTQCYSADFNRSVKSAPQIGLFPPDNLSSEVSSVMVERMSLPERRTFSSGRISKIRWRSRRIKKVPVGTNGAIEAMISSRMKHVQLYDT